VCGRLADVAETWQSVTRASGGHLTLFARMLAARHYIARPVQARAAQRRVAASRCVHFGRLFAGLAHWEPTNRRDGGAACARNVRLAIPAPSPWLTR
jgi:hypothetical protein